MSIEALSSELAQEKLLDQVHTAVLAKTLDQTRTLGEQLALLLGSGAPPAPLPESMGISVDVKA